MNMDILYHHVNTEAGTETTRSYSQLIFELALGQGPSSSHF